jgi:hypothetical protein
MIHRLLSGRTGIILFAAAASGGFFVGLTAHWGTTPPDLTEISTYDTVSLRFPSEWAETVSPAAATYAFASADTNLSLFDPNPVYPASAARQASAGTPTLLEQSTPSASEPATTESTVAAAKPAIAVASVSPVKPAVTPPRAPVKRSNAVLSEAQIASIKRRLNLTPDQARYWPAVAAELRKMEYKKDQQGGKATAAVDMSKVNIEGLKSAGFPLVMSFNDDQRQELKSLAHLLGLEKVLANF